MGFSTAGRRILTCAAIAFSLSACGGGSNTQSSVPFVSRTSPETTAHREPPRPPTPRVRIGGAQRSAAMAAGWTPVKATPPFGSNGAGTALLLTDGTVLISDNTSNWYKLTPAIHGSYENGTWTQMASMPSGYGPLYFASAVLANGQVIVEGGEYNFFKTADSNMGAIYDPVGNTWTTVSPPTGWTKIGDAPASVLSDGTFMLGNCCSNTQALMAPGTTTWTATGTGKADSNSEEGWTLLPNGNVLTVDVSDPPNTELFTESSGTWSSAGATPDTLISRDEIGPQILRPNGTVFVVGATGQTAIYHSKIGTWSAGPALPVVNGKQLDVADGPATLLTNEKVMLVASPGQYLPPAYFYMLSGTNFVALPGPPNAANDASYNVRLLLLPNGQVLETDGTNDVEIYTPDVKTNSALAPVISSVPTTLTHGTTYQVSGVGFNGASQANMYGDDAQMATNYPLVRITNSTTHDVFYARTHDHSFMGVASPMTVTTNFDVPANIELGASTLEVVANGVPSAPVSVTIQ